MLGKSLFTLMMIGFALSGVMAEEQLPKAIEKSSGNWWTYFGIAFVLILIILLGAFFPSRRSHLD